MDTVVDQAQLHSYQVELDRITDAMIIPQLSSIREVEIEDKLILQSKEPILEKDQCAVENSTDNCQQMALQHRHQRPDYGKNGQIGRRKGHLSGDG